MGGIGTGTEIISEGSSGAGGGDDDDGMGAALLGVRRSA
jgi:hypothetical protein